MFKPAEGPNLNVAYDLTCLHVSSTCLVLAVNYRVASEDMHSRRPKSLPVAEYIGIGKLRRQKCWKGSGTVSTRQQYMWNRVLFAAFEGGSRM